MSDSVQPQSRQPTRLPYPWNFPGKSTGVGCMKVKSESEVAQSCPSLSDPIDCSPPGSAAHGIFQARALEWVATAFYLWEHYSQHINHLSCMCTQLHPTPCDPRDCSPPDSSVQGILQARILGWSAISSSRGSSHPGTEPTSLMPYAYLQWLSRFFTTSTTWAAQAGQGYKSPVILA